MPPSSKEQLEQLQIAELLEQASERAAKRADRVSRGRMTERSLRNTAAAQRDIRSRCAHKKGGKGASMLFQGNDSNYAVVKHTLSHGPTIVICQRCSNVWEPPNEKLRAKGATLEMRKEYMLQATEYNKALNFPTDNEPSGTVLFSFTRYDSAA
jgi:hypothetical protein